MADRARDLAAVALEDRRFGAGRVVLGHLADRLEQPGAERVVQELRRDARMARTQAGLEFGAQAQALGRGVEGDIESGRFGRTVQHR
jgi:hypothetical protein